MAAVTPEPPSGTPFRAAVEVVAGVVRRTRDLPDIGVATRDPEGPIADGRRRDPGPDGSGLTASAAARAVPPG
ncbi:hypothetical protein FHX34_106139 [Actinoplanes teichomyceticus]|uniref:Uncharacterized protein n=1 Tax=Actinoplanes teichomyceticus TaxID=1867 RepID=A0A561VIG6_ACTTI|nr:hypothetical protein FHX34_106139 [Actinoplanes teichomyceticus]GIF15779.1 hypothetical protein Ate01nite_58110 [Actinoplanes teichomyceticus]